MLSKLGSYRKSIPPEIALEHLRKPSIKPDPNSKSIFIPADPTSEATPMDVGKGKGKAVPADPRTATQNSETAMSDPGTSQSLMINDIPGCPGTSQQQLSADVIIAVYNWVDGISPNPRTSQSDPGTSLCMPVMTRGMRAKPRPEPPMQVVEQNTPEDPMSVDQPDESEDPMSVDDQAQPEEPVSGGVQAEQVEPRPMGDPSRLPEASRPA